MKESVRALSETGIGRLELYRRSGIPKPPTGVRENIRDLVCATAVGLLCLRNILCCLSPWPMAVNSNEFCACPCRKENPSECEVDGAVDDALGTPKIRAGGFAQASSRSG